MLFKVIWDALVLTCTLLCQARLWKEQTTETFRGIIFPCLTPLLFSRPFWLFFSGDTVYEMSNFSHTKVASHRVAAPEISASLCKHSQELACWGERRAGKHHAGFQAHRGSASAPRRFPEPTFSIMLSYGAAVTNCSKLLAMPTWMQAEGLAPKRQAYSSVA